MALVNEFGHWKRQTDGIFFLLLFFFFKKVCERGKSPLLKDITSLNGTAPCVKENHFCNWSWRHHLVLTSICAKQNQTKKKTHTSISVCTEFVVWLSDLKADLQQGWLASFGCITSRQRHSWPCYCNLPTSLLLSEGFFTEAELTAYCLISASSVRCLNGPNAAAERRGRRRKWRSRSTPTQRASLGRRSPQTVVTSGGWRIFLRHLGTISFFVLTNEEFPAHMCLLCLCERWSPRKGKSIVDEDDSVMIRKKNQQLFW